MCESQFSFIKLFSFPVLQIFLLDLKRVPDVSCHMLFCDSSIILCSVQRDFEFQVACSPNCALNVWLCVCVKMWYLYVTSVDNQISVIVLLYIGQYGNAFCNICFVQLFIKHLAKLLSCTRFQPIIILVFFFFVLINHISCFPKRKKCIVKKIFIFCKICW